MVRVTEAIFENGVFKPTEAVGLREHQRVLITVEELPQVPVEDREAALGRFRESVARLGFTSDGPYPKREELYDRKLPE